MLQKTVLESEKAGLKKGTESVKSKNADSVPKKEKQEGPGAGIWEEEEFVPDYEKQKSGSRKTPRASTPKPNNRLLSYFLLEQRVLSKTK